jgi:hypothetical protein
VASAAKIAIEERASTNKIAIIFFFILNIL